MKTIHVKALAAALISLIAVGTAQAQDQDANRKPGRAGQRQNGMARLMKQLDLTTEQKEKIKKIQDATKAKVQPIRDNKSLTEEQKKDQLKAISKDSMKQILEVLTPEQKAKLQELRSKQRGQRGQRAGRAGNGPATPGATP
ncbi:MAG: hypothetical protein SFU56_01700 [Capsulimonadales bacterium]|nr:hypothetical protein [Capsulimonadales bacterium]